MNAAPVREASLVIGLGQPDRGDDAVGPVVAARIRELAGDGVEVLTREDPTALVQAWDGYRIVVLVDSILSGADPGSLTVRHAGTAAEPLPTHAFTAAGRGGSHAFGVAGAVELSRTLGTLPEQLAIVGIEAETFDHGPMSDAVVACVDDAVATVIATLAHAIGELRDTEAGSCA
ncbi:hydrogenase maturation protease [Demequina salsinemoris]|uniref:hydrogenase maturation protease n=1 Tax=Demequina salsinemoris TaxID=577470 RepID=UPI000781263B|nr:hydrogenase maturation protease [Demequina salsinemoris]